MTLSSIGVTNDRLGRPTQVTVTGDAAAMTNIGYGFTVQTQTDASGSYTTALDKLGHPTSITDPIHGTPFTFAYGADGQLTSTVAPNGNTTTSGYDALGRLLTRTTGTRASATLAYNRARKRLTEASAITGDPANGTATTAYDPLGRLTSFQLPTIRTQSATWQEVPNRAGQTIDGVVSTQAFDDANRPNTGGYAFDADGRMTARPGSAGSLEWDSLGRLIRVRATPGGTVIATYTYDALDRLRTVARPGQPTLRFRNAGTGTAVAQVADDATGTAIRNVATGPEGTVVEDWLGASRRLYGTNGHHDTTWTADDTGSVTATLRYDPWGTVLRSSGTLPDWRFQGSWTDTSTSLAWSIARWYDPLLASFASADALLGQLEIPQSRQRTSYAVGDPVDGWDPMGRASKTLYRNAIRLGQHEWSYDTGQVSDWLHTPTGFRYGPGTIRWRGSHLWALNRCYSWALRSESRASISMLMDGSFSPWISVELVFQSGATMKVLWLHGDDDYWANPGYQRCMSGCRPTSFQTSTRWGRIKQAHLVIGAYFTMRGYETTVVPITNEYRVIFGYPGSTRTAS